MRGWARTRSGRVLRGLTPRASWCSLAVVRRGLAIALVTASIVTSVPTASATLIPCLYDEDTGQIDATTEAGFVQIYLVNGDEIYANSQPCGGATTATAETITIAAEEGAEVEITLEFGPFAPGRTDEGDDSSEIEFQITGGPALVTITGSSGPERITAGSVESISEGGPVGALNLNGAETTDDDDLFIEYGSLLALHVALNGGNDRFDAGGDGDSSLDRVLKAFQATTTVEGGAGSDTLEPGAGRGEFWGDAASAPLDDAADTLTMAWVPAECTVTVRNDLVGAESSFACGLDGEPFDAGLFERIVGHAGPSFLVGSGGGDVIRGGGGDDDIVPGLGADEVVGGPGWDALIGGVSAPLTVDLTEREVRGEGLETYTGIEGVFSTSDGNDVFVGAPGQEIESVAADGGANVLDLRSAGRGYTIYATTTVVSGPITAGLFATGFDILGTRYDDAMIGGAFELPNGHDEFRGLRGDDRLEGGPGPDTLIGADGDDVIKGGAGIDTCAGGPGFDVVSGCEL